MVWVAPQKTAGLASSLLWQTEDEIGGAGGEAARWAFEFQRHRLANAGALAEMRKRLEGGGMYVRRIVTHSITHGVCGLCSQANPSGGKESFDAPGAHMLARHCLFLLFTQTQMQNVNSSCHWME